MGRWRIEGSICQAVRLARRWPRIVALRGRGHGPESDTVSMLPVSRHLEVAQEQIVARRHEDCQLPSGDRHSGLRGTGRARLPGLPAAAARGAATRRRRAQS